MKAILLLLCALSCYGEVIDSGSASDRYCTGGTAWVFPISILPPGTNDVTLRFGPSFSCHIPAAGDSVVTLTFREPTYRAAGQRQFSVTAQGQPTPVTGLDLVAVAGYLIPYSVSFAVPARNGYIDLAFVGELGNALVSSIEVVPSGVAWPVAALYVDAEVPDGVIDGENAIFRLAFAPSPAGSLQLFMDGVVYQQGTDYDLTGQVITFRSDWIPWVGVMLQAWYRR